jgi:Lactoylglutathione lyase and related lyases
MRLFAPQSRDHAMSQSAQSTSGKSKPAKSPAASGYRLLHTMIRVLDLDKSLDFYTRHLGMKLLAPQ